MLPDFLLLLMLLALVLMPLALVLMPLALALMPLALVLMLLALTYLGRMYKSLLIRLTSMLGQPVAKLDIS
jgi:hypothetical protein